MYTFELHQLGSSCTYGHKPLFMSTVTHNPYDRRMVDSISSKSQRNHAALPQVFKLLDIPPQVRWPYERTPLLAACAFSPRTNSFPAVRHLLLVFVREVQEEVMPVSWKVM